MAKRDIKVYKIGIYADNDSFNPFFYSYFGYTINQIVFEKVKFTDTINCGFHSYINCELVSSYNKVNLYSCGKLILWVSLLTVYLGEFIIPEGMEIDLENSDLTKGIIKFRNDNITLEDIPCIIRDDIKINGFINTIII